LRVFDDPKKLDRDYPEAMVKVRELVNPSEEDSLMIAGWAGEPTGPKPEETALKACGQFRLHAGQKYNDRHKLARSDGVQVHLGDRVPDVSSGTRTRRNGTRRIIRSARCSMRIWRS